MRNSKELSLYLSHLSDCALSSLVCFLSLYLSYFASIVEAISSLTDNLRVYHMHIRI